jgi:hypothetical protein
LGVGVGVLLLLTIGCLLWRKRRKSTSPAASSTDVSLQTRESNYGSFPHQKDVTYEALPPTSAPSYDNFKAVQQGQYDAPDSPLAF